MLVYEFSILYYVYMLPVISVFIVCIDMRASQCSAAFDILLNHSLSIFILSACGKN